MKETNSLPSFSMLIAYWIINVRNIKETNQNSPVWSGSIQSGPVRSGPVRFSPVYLVLPIYKWHQALWPADYLVLSGDLGKPCTRVICQNIGATG